MKHWAVYLLFQPVCLLTAISVVLSSTLFQTNWIYILQFCTYINFTHRMISLEFQERFLHKNEIPEYASCNPWKSKIKPDLKLADLPFKAASPCTSRLLLDLLEVLEVIFWPTALTSYSGRKQNWNGFCVKLKFKISWWGYSVVMTAGLSLWPNSSFKWKNLRFTLLNGAQSGQKCAFHLVFFFFNIHRLQIDLPRSDHQHWVLPNVLQCLNDSIHRTAWVCWVCHCARMSFGPHQHNHHLAHEFCLFVVLSSSSKYN